MGKKLIMGFIRSEFKKEGYTLLTIEYENNKQNLEYICPKGHKGKISWSNFKQGQRCFECSRKRKTIEFICEECGSTYRLKKTPNKGRPKLCGVCLKNKAIKKAKDAQYHKKPKYRLKNRKWRLKNYYNLSMDDYAVLMKKQNSVCAICGNSNGNKPLVVDHCHVVNKVRGLLCDKCNRAIGVFNDDPAMLQNAILYLMDKGEGNGKN